MNRLPLTSLSLFLCSLFLCSFAHAEPPVLPSPVILRPFFVGKRKIDDDLSPLAIGHWQEAANTLELNLQRSYYTNPLTAEIYYRLFILHQKMGHEAVAEQWWEKSRSQFQSDKEFLTWTPGWTRDTVARIRKGEQWLKQRQQHPPPKSPGGAPGSPHS
jgi:hypothetical protein